jgi:hypothetical protein
MEAIRLYRGTGAKSGTGAADLALYVGAYKKQIYAGRTVHTNRIVLLILCARPYVLT